MGRVREGGGERDDNDDNVFRQQLLEKCYSIFICLGESTVILSTSQS